MESPNRPRGEIEPIWAVVPGRMDSSRMRGKTMAELAGKPSLLHIVRRLQRVPSLEGIVVATTTRREDDPIAECARAAGATVYRGSAEDVLARTLEAAESAGAGTIVTVTGDSPLVDPAIVERVLAEYLRHRPDYASNSLRGHSFPVGLGVQAYPASLLGEIEGEAVAPRDREHVTPFIYEHPERFRLLGVEPSDRHRRPDLRLTLDTPEDYELISAIYDALYEGDELFGLDAVLDFLDDRPELASVNSHVRQIVP